MLFNSIDFLLFFPLVTVVYFLLPHRVRWVWLLVTSYFFYMCWNPKYVVLIALSTVVTWLSGLLIGRAGRVPAPRRRALLRRLWVALSFVINLAVLFFFKYFGFFWENLAALAGLAGITLRQPGFDLLLPVGISFYSFQALGYTVDVYRGELPPERNLFRYALFVSFFPQLVAGPIERSRNLLTQLYGRHDFDPDRVRDGLLLMLWGMFEKVVVADRIAYLVTHVFDRYQELPGVASVLAVLLFGVQLYCDFAGYSDIARGAAEVLGFRLMVNFRQPYFARSTQDFWRRWHISLSSWFRDYLYIPLGGSRKGTARKYWNLLAVQLTSGLWHGANWTYVVWGGLNGLYQIAGAALAPWRERICSRLHIRRESAPVRVLSAVFVLLLYDFSLLFLRAPSLRPALSMGKRVLLHLEPFALRGDALYTIGLAEPQFHVLLWALAALLIGDLLKERLGEVRPYLARLPLPVRWVVYLVGLFVVLLFGMYGPGFSEAQFIYFQF